MQTATSFKPIKKPYIRKVYKGHSLMIGIPRKIISDLDLASDDYVHLYYDEFNDQLIVRKVPQLEELKNE